MKPENVALLTLPAKAQYIRDVLQKSSVKSGLFDKPLREEITTAIACFEIMLIELENLRAARAREIEE